MSKRNDRDDLLGGIAWKFAERVSSQGVSFVISIVLARLLSPSEYGIIAMMNIFILFANVFVVSGFSSSLIQKKDADKLDFSTMFYCSLVVSILMYGVLFLVAPYVAKYYSMPEMTTIMRVFSLSLIFNSYQAIQSAYISRHLLFKKNFYTSFIVTFVAGVVGIIMAYKGYGVWALVAQYLCSSILGIVALSVIVEWHPELIFSMERAKSLMNYGSKILGSTLIGTLYKEIRQLAIGAYYTTADLALYNRGAQLPKLVTTNIDGTMQAVLFPVMSNHGNDPERVKGMLKRAITTSSYVTYFFLTLMAVASKPLIHVLLTDKWIDCVPYMQIFCISLMLMTISTNNIQALKAVGQSNAVLKLEMYKKPVFLIVVLAALPFGVMAVALTSPLNSFYALWTNMGPTAKYLNYTRREQFKDLSTSFLLAIALATVTWPLTLIPCNPFVIMALQCIIGTVVYIALSILFRVDAYYYCKDIIRNKVLKK